MARVGLGKLCRTFCVWLIALYFCCLHTRVKSSATWQNDMKGKVDAFMDNIIKCRNIAGMNVAIVKDNGVLYTQGYGLADIQNGIKFTNQTLTNVASLTKAFGTALLSKQLSMSTGLYNWDTPVRKILGDDFFFYNKELTLQATLRDLGVHRTGLPDFTEMRFQNITRKQIAKRIRFLKPESGFRFKYSYNNIMFILLSYVSEVLGNASWEKLITKYIYTPLGMTGSSFTNVADLDAENVAKPYHTYNGTFVMTPLSTIKHWGKFGASGSVLVNSDGMAKWMLMHLNQGKNQDGQQVVPRNWLQETYNPYVSTPLPTNWYTAPNVPVTYIYDRYSPGWRNGYYRGLAALIHRGTSWGYGALITLIPSLKIGVFTGLNSYDPAFLARHLTHTYLLDLAMGQEPWVNLSTACTYPIPWVNGSLQKQDDYIEIDKTRTARHPLKNYIGTYGNYAGGNISVTIGENAGSLRFTWGIIGHWTIWPYTGNKFKGEYFVKSPGFRPVVTFMSSKQNSIIDQLQIFDFLFIRNLKMSSAPPPPTLDSKANIKIGCVSRSCEPRLSVCFPSSAFFLAAFTIYFVLVNS